MDLLYELQILLPKAIQWAEEHSQLIQEKGINLSEDQTRIAKQVGVTRPEQIRLLEVDNIPIPNDKKLKEASDQIGFFQDAMMGLTLGHSIYIVKGGYSEKLLSHELRHVYHYEVFGSIPAFLVEYLKQIALVGYENSVLEQDARNHEISD